MRLPGEQWPFHGCAAPRTPEDVQKHADDSQVAIEQVGVGGPCYPITVLDMASDRQSKIATISVSVGLPYDAKGTYVSRFIEVLEQRRGEMMLRTIPSVLLTIKLHLAAESARIEVRLPYYLERCARERGTPALMNDDCSFDGEMNGQYCGLRVGGWCTGHQPLPLQHDHQPLLGTR